MTTVPPATEPNAGEIEVTTGRGWNENWSAPRAAVSAPLLDTDRTVEEPPDGSVTYSKNLLQDLRLECDSEEHREAIRIAVGSAILWPLGSLVLFAALLVPVRRPLLQQRPNSLSRATSFLHRE